MASLTDIRNVTERLVAQAQEVHDEVESGELDFARLVTLSDALGMEADRLASMFQNVNDAFAQRIDGPADPESDDDLSEDLKPSQRGKSGGNGSGSVDNATRQELYERAKRMGVQGRSEMSKEELAQAIRGK
jgi:hypothetical protein